MDSLSSLPNKIKDINSNLEFYIEQKKAHNKELILRKVQSFITFFCNKCQR